MVRVQNMANNQEVISENCGAVLRLRLNRPKPIHALNLGMVEILTNSLLAALKDNNIKCVLIDHFDGRGFCAGGDIAMLAKSGAQDGVEARAFFFAEYRLNHLIHTFPKPIISVLDGITMGGGVGLSIHGKYRVITPNTIFAMPETGIGLFPDVGGSWFLPRLEGRIGLWLALTGARLRAGDCMRAGIGTQFIDTESIETLKANIIGYYNGETETPPNSLCEKSPEPILLTDSNIEKINKYFASDDVVEIFERLKGSDDEWAKEQLAILETKSPQTMVVTAHQLKLGAVTKDFSENMQMEYRIGARVISLNDFQEGVRALIFDKDNNPNWKPKTIYEVDKELIAQIFAPLPQEQEWKSLEELA